MPAPHRFQVIPISALGVHLPAPLFDAWLCALIVLTTEVLREGIWTRRTRADSLASIGVEQSAQMALLLSQLGRGLMTLLVCLTLLTLWKIGVGLRRLAHGARQPVHN